MTPPASPFRSRRRPTPSERREAGHDRDPAARPSRAAAAATPRAFAALWARPSAAGPAAARAARRGRRSRAPSRRAPPRSTRPSSDARRPGPGREPLRDAADEAAEPLRRRRPPRPPRRSRRASPRAASPAGRRPGRRRWRRRPAARAAGPGCIGPDPRLEGVDHRCPVGEDVGVVPFGRRQRPRSPAGRRRSCRRTRRPRRRTGPSGRPRRAVEGNAPSNRSKRPDERGRIEAAGGRGRGRASPPSCSCRASRRRRPAAARRRVGDDLLPRLERDAGTPGGLQLGVVRCDRRQRLRHREAVRRRRRRDVRRVVLPGERDRRPPRALPCRATDRRGRSRLRRRRPTPRAAPRRSRPRRRPRRRGSAHPDGSAGHRGREPAPHRSSSPGHAPGRSRAATGCLDPLEQQLQDRRRARLLVRRAVAGPEVAPDVDAVVVGDGHVRQPDRLRVASRRQGRRCPVTDAATAAPNRSRAPSAIARATWALTAPWAASTAARHAEELLLGLVGVRDHAAREVAAGARPRP